MAAVLATDASAAASPTPTSLPELPAGGGDCPDQSHFLNIVGKVSRWIAASDRHVRCLFAEDRSTSTTATQLSPSVLSEAGELERTALAERLRQDAVDRAAAAAAARLARAATAGTTHCQANNHGRHSHSGRSNACWAIDTGSKKSSKRRRNGHRSCKADSLLDHRIRNFTADRDTSKSCRVSLEFSFSLPSAGAKRRSDAGDVARRKLRSQ